MPKFEHIKKVLVIGSGPIVIGQAAEFDYAGTQACKALREEGISVVLINSNPATIMTDTDMADKVYIEPLTADVITEIIKKERPDGLLAGLGGQTGLNMAVELSDKGVLDEYGVELLGTKLDAIKKAEDRLLFKSLMQEINEPIPDSAIVETVEEGITFAEKTGYPLIVRPAYTLGGTGGGFATNTEELKDILTKGLMSSRIHQALIERSVAGWKEIEYEVMRDGNDTCIVICNMENVDPVGVHTGDSIVVAPCQTLRADECDMMKAAAIKIIRALRIAGGCNIQFALNPKSKEYVVIEVNPRVSRSSALASKATGYPIAKVTTKIAIGLDLHEIPNYAQPGIKAAFEPAIDYVVVKIPKFPFDKFSYADRSLGSQMKATGEVMSIDRNFESALLKAVISLEGKNAGLRRADLMKMPLSELIAQLKVCNDDRIFVVAEALRKNADMDTIHAMTGIDPWFLRRINKIIELERALQSEELDAVLLLQAEETGFTDTEIVELTKKPFFVIDAIRRAHGLYSVYKRVDTCAAEYVTEISQNSDVKPVDYFYSTFDKEDESVRSDKPKIVVIGSGPIRIGQGIEFDYCSVHAAWAIQKAGYESVIINNNPETVSTDFDTADKLYFVPLYIEDVINVIQKEEPKGVIVQFGGQTAINLTPKLFERGVHIMGTSVHSIDVAENRERFEILLQELGIPRPKGFAVSTVKQGLDVAEQLGYPVLVRPSYVIGGRAMQVIDSKEQLLSYISDALLENDNMSILVDKYINGKEVEVDAVSDGKDILIPGIIEHIEHAGVHSGDSITVYPTQSLSATVIEKLVEYTEKIARAVQVKGLMNIQFVVENDDVFVLEVNPRASRTVPILSKVTKVPMVDIAVNVVLGKSLKVACAEMGLPTGLLPDKDLVAVKAPVFSFQKLLDVDPALTPEMKSTGEVLGIAKTYPIALYKAMKAAGYTFAKTGKVLLSVRERNREELLPTIKRLAEMGYELDATDGTAEYYRNKGVNVHTVVYEQQAGLSSLIREQTYAFIVNIPTSGRDISKKGFRIRSAAVQYKVPLFTCCDTVKAYTDALSAISGDSLAAEEICTVDEY